MRDLFANARNLFAGHQVILFSRALKSKLQFSTRPPSERFAQSAQHEKYQVLPNIKSFQKSTVDAHPISRARVTAKAQVRNLAVASLSRGDDGDIEASAC
jgi:hypothetical protein